MQRGSEGKLVLLLLLGFGALSLWYVLRPSDEKMQYPAYSSFSTLEDGCLAAFELLSAAGHQPQRHTATEYDYPADSCMIVVHGQEDDLATIIGGGLDMRALGDWIEAGGRLVLLAPGNGVLGTEISTELLSGELYSAASLTPPPAERTLTLVSSSGSGSSMAMSRNYREAQLYELPAGRAALFSDVKQIEIAPPDYSLGMDASVLLAYGQSSPVLVYRELGEGAIYWLACPELISNDWIDRADNHRLLLAIVGSAAGGGPVWFDEYIHGYSGAGESIVTLLFRTRGGLLLLALGLAIILIYLGLAISPARSETMAVPPRRQSSEMVLAQADMYRRAGVRSAVAEHLTEGLRRALMEARHQAHPPGNGELLRWIIESGLQETVADKGLVEYLRGAPAPTSDREFLRFARSCDLITSRLRQRGAGLAEGGAL